MVEAQARCARLAVHISERSSSDDCVARGTIIIANGRVGTFATMLREMLLELTRRPRGGLRPPLSLKTGGRVRSIDIDGNSRGRRCGAAGFLTRGRKAACQR